MPAQQIQVMHNPICVLTVSSCNPKPGMMTTLITQRPNQVRIPCKCTSLESYLRLPMRLLFLIGLGQYEADKTKKCGYYIYSFYTFLAIAGSVACACLMYAVIDWDSDIRDKELSYFLAVAIWITQAILITLAISYSARKGRFDTPVQLWSHYNLDAFMDDCYRKWANRAISAVFYASFAMALAIVSISVVESVQGIPLTSKLGLMVKEDLRYGVFVIGTVFFNILWFTSQYIFCVFTVHAACCWKALGDRIQKMDGPFDQILEYAVRKHGELSAFVQQINTALGTYALIMFSTNLITVILNLYILTSTKGIRPVETISMVCWCINNFILMGVLITASWIYEGAERVSQILHARFREAYLQKRLEPVSWETNVILEDMRASNIGISPSGVFTITKPFFVAIFSIMASYYLALVQMIGQPSYYSSSWNNSAA